jgi:hypothetical protein
MLVKVKNRRCTTFGRERSSNFSLPCSLVGALPKGGGGMGSPPFFLLSTLFGFQFLTAARLHHHAGRLLYLTVRLLPASVVVGSTRILRSALFKANLLSSASSSCPHTTTLSSWAPLHLVDTG